MGSKEDERKLTDEEKLAKLELKIQDLTDTLVAFMKASVVKRKPKRRKESTKGEKEELKEELNYVEESKYDDFASEVEVIVDWDRFTTSLRQLSRS